MLAFKTRVAFGAHTFIHASLAILTQAIIHTRIGHTHIQSEFTVGAREAS